MTIQGCLSISCQCSRVSMLVSVDQNPPERPSNSVAAATTIVSPTPPTRDDTRGLIGDQSNSAAGFRETVVGSRSGAHPAAPTGKRLPLVTAKR